MANYEAIFPWLLKQEDATLSGKVVDLGDGGLRTRFGITEKNNPTAARAGFFEMSRDDAFAYAHDYYRHLYWFPCRLDEISSDEVAASLFSFAVNDGPGEAVKLIQRAADVQVDGIMGAMTLGAINRANATLMAQALRDEQANYYREIAPTHPVVAQDIDGLLKRAGRKYPNLN